MSKAAVYDTRFFAILFGCNDEQTTKKIRREMTRNKRYVSSVVVHELYHTAIATEGRETAQAKVSLVKQDFEVVPVDAEIAEFSAELRHKYHISMGDSMIAATACALKAFCITDDQHIRQIKEIQTEWL